MQQTGSEHPASRPRPWSRTIPGPFFLAASCLLALILPAQSQPTREEMPVRNDPVWKDPVRQDPVRKHLAYTHGDVAASDVIAPFEFAVVNPEQTERLRQQEADNIPPIYRWNTWAALQAEEKFLAAFSKTRADFLNAVQRAAGKHPLDHPTTTHPTFWRFVHWFKNQHPQFPLTTNLAIAWAVAQPDHPWTLPLQAALRDTMSRYLRPDLPAHADSRDLYIISRDTPNSPLSLADLSGKDELLSREQVWSVSEARAQLARRLAPASGPGPTLPTDDETSAFTPFLAQFVVENLTYDHWLTTQKRHQRTAQIFAFDQYSPGQIVVRAGQVIDSRAKAALDVLTLALQRQQQRATPAHHQTRRRASPKNSARAEAPRAEHSASPESPRAEAPSPEGPRADAPFPALIAACEWTRDAIRRYPAIFIAGLAIILLWGVIATRPPARAPATCQAYTVVMNPHRNETIFLPLPTQTTTPGEGLRAQEHSAETVPYPKGPRLETVPVRKDPVRQDWQAQMRQAEQRAQELLALVRAGLAPHLAKELTHQLVQQLLTQRATLLRAHQLAEQEILAIETRFDKIYHELQQRVAAYERRSAELEKQLLAKADQTRQLMNATILLTQQKLQQQKETEQKFASN